MSHAVVRVHVGSAATSPSAGAGAAIHESLVALAMPPLQLPSRQERTSSRTDRRGSNTDAEASDRGPLRRALSSSDVVAPASLPGTGTGTAGRASPSLSQRASNAWEPHGSPSSSRGSGGVRSLGFSNADTSNRRGRSMELDSVAVSPVLKSAVPPPVDGSSRHRGDSFAAADTARRKSHSARSTATQDVIQKLRSRTMTLPNPLSVPVASGPDESSLILPVPVPVPVSPLRAASHPAPAAAASASGSEDSPPPVQRPRQQPQDSNGAIYARTTDGSEESLSRDQEDSEPNDSPRHATHPAAPTSSSAAAAAIVPPSLGVHQDAFASPRSLAAFSASGALTSRGSAPDVIPQKIMLVPPRRSVRDRIQTDAVLRPGLPSPRFPPFPYNAASEAAALKRDEHLAATMPPARNRDVFEGRNSFVHVRAPCLTARSCTLVLGPGWPAAVFVGLLIALCTALFVALPANTLRLHTNLQLDGSFSSEEYAGASVLGLCAMILSVLLSLACEVSLVLVAATDPGILPRLRLRFECEASTAIVNPGESRQAAHAAMTRAAKVRQSHAHRPRLLVVGPSSSSGSSPSPSLGSGSSAGSSFPADLKYCESCEIHRPLRAVHCNVCGNCVLKFDHHCPWLGTCVGARNYRAFHWFLWTLSAQILLILGVCVCHLRLETMLLRNESDAAMDAETASASLRRAMASSPLSLILPSVSLLSGCFVLPLLSLHLFLVSRNLTTNELVKGVWSSSGAAGAGVGGNPFDRGCGNNWREVMCGEAGGESYLQLERDASLPPLLPRSRPLKPKDLPAHSSAVAAKYAAPGGDIESGVVLASSPSSLDVDRPSEHSRVRFVDAFEMAELEGRWMRRLKTTSAEGRQGRVLHREEDAVVFHVQVPPSASLPPSPSPPSSPPPSQPHAAAHRDHDSLLHLPGFAPSSAASSPAARVIHTPTAAAASVSPVPASGAASMVAYPSFAFPLMSLPMSPPPDASSSEDADDDAEGELDRDADLERGLPGRSNGDANEAGVEMTERPRNRGSSATTAASTSASAQQRLQVQSTSNLNHSAAAPSLHPPPQQQPQQLQRGSSFWSHHHAASVGSVTVHASALMHERDGGALDTEPESSEVGDATRVVDVRRSTASRLPPNALSASQHHLSPSLAPSLAGSSPPIELRMLSSSPTPP